MKECLRIACVAVALRRAKARSVSPLANGSDYLDRVPSCIDTSFNKSARAYRSPDANMEQVKTQNKNTRGAKSDCSSRCMTFDRHPGVFTYRKPCAGLLWVFLPATFRVAGAMSI
jgi:hypothetical protein